MNTVNWIPFESWLPQLIVVILAVVFYLTLKEGNPTDQTFEKWRIILGLLIPLDIGFTLIGIGKYGLQYELNPFVRALYSIDPLLYPLGGFFMIGALAIYGYCYYDSYFKSMQKFMRIALVALTLLYSITVLNHLSWVIVYGI